MKYNIIVAMDQNNGIGKDNKLPWHYSEDLKYFSKTTKSTSINMNALIMGRKTYESIGFALPQRVNYVLSRSLNQSDVDSKIHLFGNLEDLLKDIETKNYNECWIIGGAEIYKLFLESKTEVINEIYVTKIKKNYDCDTFFPNITNNKFIIDRGWSGTSSDLEFIIYKRKL